MQLCSDLVLLLSSQEVLTAPFHIVSYYKLGQDFLDIQYHILQEVGTIQNRQRHLGHT